MQKASKRGLGKILRGVQTFFLLVAWRGLCALPVNPNTAVSFGIGRIGRIGMLVARSASKKPDEIPESAASELQLDGARHTFDEQ